MTATQKRKTRKHLKNKRGGNPPGPLAQKQEHGIVAPVSPPPSAIPSANVVQSSAPPDNVVQSSDPPANVVQSSAPVQPAPAQSSSWLKWPWQWLFSSKSGGSRRTHRKRTSSHKTHRKHNK